MEGFANTSVFEAFQVIARIALRRAFRISSPVVLPVDKVGVPYSDKVGAAVVTQFVVAYCVALEFQEFAKAGFHADIPHLRNFALV